jgi:hypothetical protein
MFVRAALWPLVESLMMLVTIATVWLRSWTLLSLAKLSFFVCSTG